MRTAKYYIYSILVVFFVLLTACATTTDPADAYKGETPQQIFQKGEDALRDKNYAEAIKRFEALDAQYPYGSNTETAQLHIIYAYYMNSDYVAAEAAADRFIHSHPANPHVDYAYYMRGLANYYQNMGVFERLFAVDFATRDLTQVKKSFNDFDTLQRNYPQSSFAPAAHQYTIYLRDVLANHQLQVAQYYFSRGAYVASANRAAVVVQNYQGTPAVPDALVLMSKSYYQLHLPDQMNQSIQVLNYNYPNSKYMAKVTGRQLTTKHFSVVPRKEAAIPQQKSPMTPPAESQSYYADYPVNGDRGGTTTVADLVKSVRASGVFAAHSGNTQQQSVGTNGQAPVAASQAPVQAQTQAQAQTPAAPTQAQTTQAKAQAPVDAQANGNRTAGRLSLNNLLDDLSDSNLFATHSKKPVAQDANVVADNTAPAAAQLQSNLPAVQQNGTRR